MTFESQNKKTSPQTTAQGPRPGSYSCTTRAGLLDVKCPVQGKGKSLTDQQKIKQYLYCFGVLYRWIFLDRNRTYTVLLLLYERWYPATPPRPPPPPLLPPCCRHHRRRRRRRHWRVRSLRSGCPYSRYTLETKWLRGSGTRPCTPVNRRSARRKKGTVRVETTRGWFTTQRSFRLCKDRRSSAIRTAQPVKRFAV